MAEKIAEEKNKFEYKHGFRHTSTIIALFVIYFIIFGILSNYWEKGTDIYRPFNDGILFIYRNIMNVPYTYYHVLDRVTYFDFGTWYIALILIATAIYVGYSQDFLIYAIKRNLWLVPITIGMSIFWNGIFEVFYYRDFLRSGSFIYTIFLGLGRYFTSIQGYINLIVLLVIFVGGGLLGGYLKILRRETLRKKAELLLAEEASSS